MDFFEDLNSMPFRIIERAEFHDSSLTIIITFKKSGNVLKGEAPNHDVFNQVKEEMIKNIGEQRVAIT